MCFYLLHVYFKVPYMCFSDGCCIFFPFFPFFLLFFFAARVTSRSRMTMTIHDICGARIFQTKKKSNFLKKLTNRKTANRARNKLAFSLVPVYVLWSCPAMENAPEGGAGLWM